MLEACGFPCEPAGEREFGGKLVPMFKPTGERKPAQADVIGYGGAAFGGKSYGLLILARVAAELWPGVQIAYFRRTYPELNGPGAAMQNAYDVFGGVAKDRDGGKEWNWDNDSTFYFRHCQNEQDVYAYQSQQIDILLTDEATHFSWFIMDYLLTRNRVTVDHAGFRPFAVLTANPGNVGHVWYSTLFDVMETQGKHETVKHLLNPNGKYSNTVFIPAFLEDNQIGVSRDPGYEDRLMQRDPVVARALRKGDWTIFAGQMFPSWQRERLSCTPFEIPSHWPMWRAVDYGLAHPWAAGWFAKNPQTGRLYIPRAVKQSGLSDTAQARMLKEMTLPGEQIIATYASPDMWARKTSKEKVFTAVDEYKDEGIILTQADNDRMRGVIKIHSLLEDMLDGKPRLQIFETCYDVFNVMTVLVRDPKNTEDVLKIDGDDAFDMLKYGLTNEKRSEIRKIKSDPNPLDKYKGMV